MRHPTVVRSCLRLLALVTVGAAVLALLAPDAAAHTAFETSDPVDGSSVAGPVSVVTISFTGAAEPTGEGFLVLDPGGVVREPSSMTSSEDQRVWSLHFDPPLGGGDVGVRWTVKAPDAHPIEGSFRFTVDVADAAPVAELGDPSATRPGDAGTLSEGPASETGVVQIDQRPAAASLDDFLTNDASETRAANLLGGLGRFVGLAGALVGIGALAFAAIVLRGHPRDVVHVMFWVRRAAILALVGAAVELVAQIWLESSGPADVLSQDAFGNVFGSSFGAAIALRTIGAVALIGGASIAYANASERIDPIHKLKEAVTAGSGDGRWRTLSIGHLESVPPVRTDDHAWAPSNESRAAAIGATLLVASYLFDGHTVSDGNRLLTAIVDVVHVVGGAIWAGGVFMIATVLWRRHRDRRELRAFDLAVRFSVVAAVALAAVGLAGLALTVTIVDSPSQLFTTDWGQLLVFKTLFVGIAVVAGAYNHLVLVPMLRDREDHPELARHFRNIVAIESATLVGVLVLTAALVGAGV